MSQIVRWTSAVVLFAVLLVPLTSPNVHAADDAQMQLETTASAMLALDSFHFELQTTAGSTTFQNMITLNSVTGDIERPASFHATIDVAVAILSLQLEAIGIDGKIWVKNPISGGDDFVQLSGDGSDIPLPEILINPDQLVTDVLKFLDEPVLAGTETLDGQETTVITGSVDPNRIAALGTTSDELGEFKPASTPLEVKMWIDDQNRLLRIDFTGPLFAFEEDTGRLVRSFTFSNFDEALDIVAPA